jgi:ferrous iron transport protein A
MTTSADMLVGQRAYVVQIDGTDQIGTRLLEMGLTPGVELRLVATAPLGDPLEFEVRGYRLSLRRSEAARVRIDSRGFA